MKKLLLSVALAAVAPFAWGQTSSTTTTTTTEGGGTITEFTPGSNGIEVRPIRQITGAEEFAEVFFDGTRAPKSGVIGGLGNGWLFIAVGIEARRTFTSSMRSL